MIIPPDILGALVVVATTLVAAVPIILLLFWIRDWKGGKLW